MAEILIADDQPTMLRLLMITLPAEHEVSQATDGEKALRVAEEVVPDLVLLEINMPGKDGLEVLRQIRQNPRLASAKAIVISARIEEATRLLALQIGAIDYVTKPFNLLALVERVNAALGPN